MAVRGTKPKPDDQKVTRVPLQQGWTDVPDIPFAGQRPDLKGIGLPRLGAASKGWWERISTMAHCILWTEGDWQFALDTLRVHAAFIKTGRGANELRMREKQMGTTLDARRDLRIRYVSPMAGILPDTEDEDAGPSEQTSRRLADFEAERRRRLLEAE